MDNVAKLEAATQHFLGEAPVAGPTDEEFGASQEPVVTCRLCNAQLALKTKQSGGWMISCQGYPACRANPLWLPSFVKEASVTDQSCPSCTNNPSRLKLSVTRSAMAPFYPDVTTCCLGGCDSDILEILGIDKLNSGQLTQPSQAPPTGGGDFGGGGGRGGRRGGRRGGGGGGGSGPRRERKRKSQGDLVRCRCGEEVSEY